MDKVEALQMYIKPKTKKQMMSFLGLANYYRKFIPHFSEMVVPLLHLTKGTRQAEISLTEEAQRAFETV